jgi:hypothetical protein
LACTPNDPLCAALGASHRRELTGRHVLGGWQRRCPGQGAPAERSAPGRAHCLLSWYMRVVMWSASSSESGSRPAPSASESSDRAILATRGQNPASRGLPYKRRRGPHTDPARTCPTPSCPRGSSPLTRGAPRRSTPRASSARAPSLDIRGETYGPPTDPNCDVKGHACGIANVVFAGRYRVSRRRTPRHRSRSRPRAGARRLGLRCWPVGRWGNVVCGPRRSRRIGPAR